MPVASVSSETVHGRLRRSMRIRTRLVEESANIASATASTRAAAGDSGSGTASSAGTRRCYLERVCAPTDPGTAIVQLAEGRIEVVPKIGFVSRAGKQQIKDGMPTKALYDVALVLKGHPEIPGEFAEFLFHRGISPGGDRAQTRAGRKQARRLAVHQFHAIGFADPNPADAIELDQFTFHHHLGKTDEQIQNVEVPLFQRHLKCLHV